ncbi:MAG: condensation domain-containing protein, partial [bacterium]
LELIDLSRLSPAAREAELKVAAERTLAGMAPAEGGLFRAVLFEVGEGEQRLLLAAHHLIVDGVSWRILVEDLALLLNGDEAAQLPSKTTSFPAWTARLSDRARASELQAEAEFWRSLPPARTLPRDMDGSNLWGDAETVSLQLDDDETKTLIRGVHAAYGAGTGDVLLAAAIDALAAWTGSDGALVTIEGHGRASPFPDADPSRTVGWFTSAAPAWIPAGRSAAPPRLVAAVREALAAIPGDGTGYGLLRYVLGDPDLRRQAPPEVVFNYLGQADTTLAAAGLRLIAEDVGPQADPREPRRAALEIEGRVLDARLAVSWTYSSKQYHPATIRRLAERTMARLRELLAPVRLPAPSEDAKAAPYPLSPIQQGVLFHSLLAPGTGA